MTTPIAIVPEPTKPKPRRTSPRKASDVRRPRASRTPKLPTTNPAADPMPEPDKSLSPVAWALCVGLPLTSFGMVWLAGEAFLTGYAWLGWMAAALVAFTLIVSAPHCAAAVAGEWKTGKRDGWFVAAALEGAIVVLDLTHLAGPESLRTAAFFALVVPIVGIAVLNALAVRRHAC